jgi:RNA polymerase sigma factor (sigma-70 family)
MPDDSDSELLQRYITGRDEGAFKEIVQRHLPFVYATALRRCGGDTHRAQEITQAVFTDLARRASKLSQHTALAGWLHTSTRFAASALCRAEHRRRSRETLFSMNVNESTAEPAPDCDRLRAVIDPALDELDAHEREVILLRFFEKKSFGAIGDFFNLSEDAARKRTERALEKLRTRLSGRGITSTSAALGLVLANQATASVTAPAALVAAIGTTALSSAAKTAGSAGLLSYFFMSQSKSITVAVITLASAATVGTAVLANKISHQENILANSSTNSRLPAANSQHEFERTRDALNATLEKLRSLEAKIVALPLPEYAGLSRSAVSYGQIQRRLFADPEYVRLKRQSFREWVTAHYGDHLAELNLTPEKLNALKDILVEERIAEERARFEIMISGSAASEEETQVERRLATDAEIRALLGEDGPRAIARVKAIAVLSTAVSADFRERTSIDACPGQKTLGTAL